MRITIVGVALAVLVAACGPSEQAVFDEALVAGLAALAVDDLALAEERLGTAGTLRPDDDALLTARQALQTIVASRNAFTEAEHLAASGEHLAARITFLQVSESDTARFELAQASALSAEQRWLDDTAETLDDLLSAEDLIGLLGVITRARQAFPSPALEQLVFESRAERALLILAELGTELVAAERFTEVESLIKRVTTTFALSDSEGSLAVRRVSELADAERARVTRIRSEEAVRRQREAQQALQPWWAGPSVPTVTTPIPPINIPGLECAPDFSDPNWQIKFHQCANESGGASDLPPRRRFLPTPPSTPAPTVAACPEPSARIVLTSAQANLRASGAITTNLTTSMQGFVENQSTGILGVSSVLYEFGNATEVQVTGVVNWSGGGSLIPPGGRREFSVSNASHPVLSAPDFLRLRLIGPTLVAPTAELNAQCPAISLNVTDAFGTLTTALSFG